MAANNTFALLIEPDTESGIDCIRHLNQRDLLIVGAVGKDGVGKDVGGLAGIDELGIAIEGVQFLPRVLDRLAPDIAVVCSAAWCSMNDLLKKIAESGCNIALHVGPTFPSLSETERLRDLDELALLHGVSVACFETPDMLAISAKPIMEAPPGLIPARLY